MTQTAFRLVPFNRAVRYFVMPSTGLSTSPV
jgi:hypothetical protein